jgi:hypothetical protein
MSFTGGQQQIHLIQTVVRKAEMSYQYNLAVQRVSRDFAKIFVN